MTAEVSVQLVSVFSVCEDITCTNVHHPEGWATKTPSSVHRGELKNTDVEGTPPRLPRPQPL